MLGAVDLAPFVDKLGADFTGSVMVTKRDEPVFAAAYGLANWAWGGHATIDTRYDTASITKLFTAVATLQMVERGHFALDTPVIGYLGLDGTTISPAATVHHMLTHTSGIGDDADEEAGEEYADLFIDKPNYAIRELADNLPNFATKPANFAPGAGNRYCNVSYLLLGMMVEKASGGSFRSYVQAEVFRRAGMTRSGFFRMDVVEPDVAEGVEPIRDGNHGPITGWRRNIYSYPPIGDAAGGAYVTVGDLVAFHRAAAAGALLGPELTAGLFAPHELHGPREENTYLTGYGFEFLRAPDGRILRYWKEGVNSGVSGMLQHYPEHDVTLAILGVGQKAVWAPISAFNQIMA
jgi:CubicO group peptidase (beta-lactamase class C family)